MLEGFVPMNCLLFDIVLFTPSQSDGELLGGQGWIVRPADLGHNYRHQGGEDGENCGDKTCPISAERVIVDCVEYLCRAVEVCTDNQLHRWLLSLTHKLRASYCLANC